VLHRIQQLTVERVMFAPIINLRALMGVGSRVAEHAINVIPLYPFPVPEDMRLKEQ
jgi:peptide/nickel transport system substrate-binding protein